MSQPQEQIFRQDVDPTNNRQVFVSSERVIIGTATYATANITSVDIKRIPPNWGPAIGVGIFGALIALCGGSVAAAADAANGSSGGGAAVAVIIGLIVIGLAIWIAVNTKEQFALVLTTAGAEKQALVSKSRSDIENIIGDINRAIIMTRRGQSYAAPQPAQPDVMQQIQQLAQLHQAGVISTQDFEAKKAELLKRL
jgi:hypothetical protein